MRYLFYLNLYLRALALKISSNLVLKIFETHSYRLPRSHIIQ